MLIQISKDSMMFRILPARRAWKEIHYDNLKWNVRLLQKLLPKDCEFMAVVKANAYGHGAVPVSSFLSKIGIKAFAVATLSEGILLRKHGIQGEILILGYTPPEQAAQLSRYNLIQTVVDVQHALALNQAAWQSLRVHIKLDTGMHRLGEEPEHLERLKAIYACEYLSVCCTFSHLCVADSHLKEDVAFTREQISLFFHTAERMKQAGMNPGSLHLQGSYGVLNYPGLPLDYARIGIAMYGCLSSPDADLSRKLPLKPVLSLHARIALVKDVKAGESISYGRNFRAPHTMRIAAVTIGYADGFPRSLSNCGLFVSVRGQKAEVIGNICMDQLLIDVTHIHSVRPGDTVTLIGADQDLVIRAEDVASKAGTITNELLCRLSLREE